MHAVQVFLPEEAGGGFARTKHGMLQAAREKAQVGAHTEQHRAFAGPHQLAQALVAAGRDGQHLGDHRVVVRAHRRAAFECGVGTHAGRGAPAVDAAYLRHEACRRIFGAHAQFDRMALKAHVVLRKAQRLALGHAQLLLDEVQPRDQLRHAVLDLQPRVHFHEVERAVGAQQELQRADAGVADGGAGLACDLAHLVTQRGIDGRRGRFLDHFLEAPLRGAVALAQVQLVAVLVAQHLDLDVARAFDRAFDDDLVGAEGAGRFGAGLAQQLGQCAFLVHHAHAAPAAAGSGLEDHRVADAPHGLQHLRIAARGGRTRHGGHAGLAHRGLGLGLVAHEVDHAGRGPDENQPGVGHGLREGGVL
ncbi:hypothetical protein D9M68_533520 [compost metagenome]